MENFGQKIQLKFYMRIIEIPGWYTYSVQLSIEIPGSGFPSLYQRYTYRVLQTIQMKLIPLCVWAEQAVLGSTKSALKFKCEI